MGNGGARAGMSKAHPVTLAASPPGAHTPPMMRCARVVTARGSTCASEHGAPSGLRSRPWPSAGQSTKRSGPRMRPQVIRHPAVRMDMNAMTKAERAMLTALGLGALTNPHGRALRPLRALVALGLASVTVGEPHTHGYRTFASRTYTITEAGRAALENKS